MTVSKIKVAVAATILLGTVSAAQAGFVLTDSNSPTQNTITIVPQNDFKNILSNLSPQILTYTLGASLGVDSAGTVEFFYYGKEAGYDNIFTGNSGSKTVKYDTGWTPTSQSYFAQNGKSFGSLDVTSGLLTFNFCSYSSPGVNVGCVSNAGNDFVNMGNYQSIAFNVSGNTAWLFWDDSGAGPDDNHDDMLIKAVFTPKAVPEPATLGLLGLGLLGTWVGAKRRRKLV